MLDHHVYIVMLDHQKLAWNTMKHPDKARAMLLENLRIISEHRRRSMTIEQLR